MLTELQTTPAAVSLAWRSITVPATCRLPEIVAAGDNPIVIVDRHAAVEDDADRGHVGKLREIAGVIGVEEYGPRRAATVNSGPYDVPGGRIDVKGITSSRAAGQGSQVDHASGASPVESAR